SQDPELVLPRPPPSVRAFRSLITRLHAHQPLHQPLGGPALVRQELVDDPVYLRAGDLGHLFPPSPAVTSAGRPRPVDTSSGGGASPATVVPHTHLTRHGSSRPRT